MKQGILRARMEVGSRKPEVSDLMSDFRRLDSDLAAGTAALPGLRLPSSDVRSKCQPVPAFATGGTPRVYCRHQLTRRKLLNYNVRRARWCRIVDGGGVTTKSRSRG